MCAAIGLVAASPLTQDDAVKGQEPPDMEAIMEVWQKTATPGEHHEVLGAFVGKWDLTTRFRMGPDEPWEQSTAKGDAEWVLGKRFVRQHFTSAPDETMPEGFEGLGYLGYDNYNQKHTVTWMDTMSTMTLHYTGTCSEDHKTITVSTEYNDPFTGSAKQSKWIYKIKSNNEIVMEMHEPDPTGKMFMMGEITMKRVN